MIASAVLAAVWLLTSALSGCVTPPPAAPPPRVLVPPEAACPSCEQQIRDIARLRQELANRDAEMRDLRSGQRDQVKDLQESTREATRAKVRLRRLATRADAASYIAEVEVGMAALHASLGAKPPVALMVLAQDILASTAAPFALGDYGGAMDRAAQAEQLIALVAHSQLRNASRRRVPGEVPLQVSIPLKVTMDSNLRRQPLGTAPVVSVLKKDSSLLAHAYKGNWMRVETEGGRAGWVDQRQLGAW